MVDCQYFGEVRERNATDTKNKIGKKLSNEKTAKNVYEWPSRSKFAYDIETGFGTYRCHGISLKRGRAILDRWAAIRFLESNEIRSINNIPAITMVRCMGTHLAEYSRTTLELLSK